MIEEGDNGIRTVECLRGRLLAERVASKAAKEEADLMAKRVCNHSLALLLAFLKNFNFCMHWWLLAQIGKRKKK